MVQYEKIMKFISNAKSEGATILTGGSRPEVCIIVYFLCSIQLSISAFAVKIEYFINSMTASKEGILC